MGGLEDGVLGVEGEHAVAVDGVIGVLDGPRPSLAALEAGCR